MDHMCTVYIDTNQAYVDHIHTRQRAQGHRTYEVGIAKPEVRLLLSLQALAVLVSDN